MCTHLHRSSSCKLHCSRQRGGACSGKLGEAKVEVFYVNMKDVYHGVTKFVLFHRRLALASGSLTALLICCLLQHCCEHEVEVTAAEGTSGRKQGSEA